MDRISQAPMTLSTNIAVHQLPSSITVLPHYRAFCAGLPIVKPSTQLGFVNKSLNVHGSNVSEKTRGSSMFSANSAALGSSSSMSSDKGGHTVPLPIVMIDQDSDPIATIVQISYGDRLGALIDTMKAIKDLGLDVTKGTVSTEASILKTNFFITKMGRKIEDPSILERIRLTIINNLLKYHPESSEWLAMGAAFGIKAPKEKLDIDVATHIHVQDDGPRRSLLYIETADRPGLLLEIIRMMADINVSVESAEIDTEGLVAKDTFYVSYRDAALSSSLSQVLINSLRYYLRRPETEEDSY